MKKQGSGKNGLTALLIAAGALILIAAVVLGIMFLGGNDSDKTDASGKEGGRTTLYWNVERKEYVGKGANGTSGRRARSDGYYYVRFAVGGKQEDFRVQDPALIEKIDQLDVVGLEFDKDGVVVGVNNINQCTGGLVAGTLYVKSVEGNVIHCNNQGMYKGMDVDIEIDENTEIYDVGQTGLLCGLPGQVAEDDEIMAIRDYDGNIMYIFLEGYKEPGDVYWNLTRMYNTTTGYTTREKDAEGFYVFEMALNGQLVTVRTRDFEIASAIDAKAAKCTGLEFDENGLVNRVFSATTAANGTGTFASWAHVMEISGDQVYAVKLSGSAAGTEYETVIAKNCKIINVCGIGGEKGSYTTLQYGDQIHGLLDSRGKLCYVWVVSRLSSSDGYQLYWNVERQYDTTNKVTKRTPSADGYYYIDVATGGEQFTVKTKDKDMATKLDSYAARCFAMKITEDKEILDFQSAASIHGGSTFGSWYYVDKIDGQNLTVSRILTGDTEPTVLEGVMASDVEILNGSKVYSSHCGEYGTLKVGDRIHGLKDLDGNIRVIFIVEKEVPGPVYWNINKMTVKNGYTTRERAEDGYFYFEMAAGGKQMTLKTKDIKLATEIDNVAARCMGLSVGSNGVILKYYGASSVAGCQGGTKGESWVDVTRISGRTYTSLKDPNSNTTTAGQYFTSTMASNCKIYNVSGNYNAFCGEETTLRVGDRIHALHNRDGQTTVIFVVTRNKALDEKDSCPCAQNPIWEPWDGTTELENGKYYYLTGDVTAPTEGFLLEGKNVFLRLDGHTISSDGRCFHIKSNGRINICDHESRGKLIGNGVAGESGGIFRVYSTSAVVNLWNVDLEAGSAPVALEGGLISCSGTVSVYNCNLNNGKATSKAGNVQVSSSGTFRMFGGTMNHGSAPNAGNMNGTGRFYLEDVTVTGTGAVTMNVDAEMVVNGLTAPNVSLVKGNVTMKGNLQIGNMNITGGTIKDGGIEPESAIQVTCKPQTSQVIMTSATEAGSKALTSFDAEDYVLSYDAKSKTVTVTCTIVPQTHETAHCACAGAAEGVGEHTCTERTGWTELTTDILVASPTSGNLAFPESGNYYLPLDMELSTSIDILPGQEITLCLNGQELTGSKRIFRINGTLNITDCTEKGQVVGKAALAPVFYTYAGGTLNLFGGTLTTAYSGKTSYWGGVGAVANDAGNAADKGGSSVNMYGGTVLGGYAYQEAANKNGYGGGIVVFNTCSFSMYGGTLTGGGADQTGGNLYVDDAGIVNLLGGTITGGIGAKGADVYISDKNQNVTLGGKLTIGELYLGDDVMAGLQDLDHTSSIGILMGEPGVFAQSAEDLSACFLSLDGNYTTRYVNGKLKLDVYAGEGSHVHCVCGDTAEGMHTHECASLIYEAWESTDSLPATSGNYYLTEDVHLTDTAGHQIGENTITICLNGHKITGEGRLFWLNKGTGTLNICDHADGSGSLESPGIADGNAGGLIRHGTGSAHLNLYNITLRRTDVGGTRTLVKEGGIISCSGYMDLYNVTVENGYAQSAGNILIALTAKVNMVGCTIQNGTAVNTTGGNIRVGGNNANNPASATIIDTVVTGGSAKTYGDDISLSATNTLLTLGGKTTIDGELYLAGEGNVTLQDPDPDSRIAVTMANAGVIASSDADMSDCFRSTDGSLNVYYDERAQEIYLADEKRPEPKIHQDHCICAGAQFLPEELAHTCEAVTWIALTQDMFDNATDSTSPVKLTADGYVLDNGGHYFLNENVTINQTLTPGEGNGFALCLNGWTLKGDNVRTMYFKGTIDLCDCAYTDETVGESQDAQTVRTYAGSVVSSRNNYAAVVYVRAGGTLNLFGGNLEDSTSTTAKEGAIVYVSGTMNMYGGRIMDGCSAKNGGNINLVDGATVHIWAGQITGGSAASGGNINITNGNLYIHGGLIADGTSSGNGGNMIVASNGNVYMSGGIVEKGQSASGKNGGNIRLEGYMEMTGGTIRDGQASEGGNIAISGAGTLDMKGGTVEDGTANNGGNLVVYGKLNVMDNALIRDGISTGTSASSGGGNIYGYPNSTNIQITGGRIENGKAAHFGANIYIRGNSNGTNVGTLSFTGGIVSGIQTGSASAASSIYIHKNKGVLNIFVGGDAQVDEIRFDTAQMLKIADSGITAGASIGVSLGTGTGTVIAAVDTSAGVDYTQIFTAVEAGKKVAVENGALVITEE